MWTLNDFRPIYQEFLDRGTTVRQFCQEAGIPESRFYHWQAKLRQEVAAGQTGEFMPVSFNNRGNKVVLVDKNHPSQRRNAIQQPVCEICFPNGVTVREHPDGGHQRTHHAAPIADVQPE